MFTATKYLAAGHVWIMLYYALY